MTNELVIDLPTIALAVIVLVSASLLFTWHLRDDNFDLRDLITKPDGRVSFHKFGMNVALVVSSWAFVTLVYKGNTLPEWFFFGYMLVWTGVSVANTWSDRKLPQKPEDANDKPS